DGKPEQERSIGIELIRGRTALESRDAPGEMKGAARTIGLRMKLVQYEARDIGAEADLVSAVRPTEVRGVSVDDVVQDLRLPIRAGAVVVVATQGEAREAAIARIRAVGARNAENIQTEICSGVRFNGLD